MNPDWRDFLQAAGAQFSGDGSIADFGDAAGELAAARDATVVVPLGHLGLIRVGNEEACSFLHNQLTSDINHLGVEGVQHSAWCTAKGRMLASFLIWRQGDDYLLQLSADLVEAVAKRLKMFVLRSRVSIADAGSESALIGVAGPRSAAALEAAGLPVPGEAMRTLPFADGTVLRLDDARFEVAVAAPAAPGLWQKLAGGARPAGTPAWRWLDIQAAWPLVTAATKEEFVPQMANFERIGGVSFHKGCYPGQEIVARTQYLGKVKRHLYRAVAAEAMSAGDELFSSAAPDQACGMIVSAAPDPAGGHVALAVLMEAAADAGVRLRARDGATLQVRPVAA